jgi:DNA-nicking Smr family endonuclease
MKRAKVEPACAGSEKSVKKGKKQGISEEDDRKLWEFVTRSVRPIQKKPPEAKTGGKNTPKSPAKAAQKQAPVAAPSRTPVRPPPLPPSVPVPVFDKGEADALRRGKRPIEARLDLHGMNQSEAHAALSRTIRAGRKSGRRTLLVITGKGRAGGGVLRRLLPLWLEEFSRDVLAFSEARPEDGGAGAYYLRLRKDKKP